MALTSFDYTGATYDALTAEEFEARTWVEAQDKVFFAKKREWTGEPGSDKPLIELNNLQKEPGDAITVPLLKKLTGAGKYGGETLWDNEEAMVWYYLQCFINQIRHATGTAGLMSRQRVAFNPDAAASGALGRWLADWSDQAVFDAFYRLWPLHIRTSGSGGLGKSERWCPNWYVPVSGGSMTGYGAGPANEAAVETDEANLTDSATHKFSTGIIEDMAAEMRVNNFMPVSIDGQEYFIGLIHPYQYKQLRRDSDWKETMQSAWVRGQDNPLFTGALGVWDGVILFRHNKVMAGTTYANVKRAIFFAGNAMAQVRAGTVTTDRKTWDYEEEHRYKIGAVNGWMRGDFVSNDSNATVFNQSTMIVSTYSPQNLN